MPDPDDCYSTFDNEVAVPDAVELSGFGIPFCPPGQHYDPLQRVCVLDSGSAGTTLNGIILPSLPHDSYSLAQIDYMMQSDHKANGSFREFFEPMDRDLNSVLMGGYFKVDGPDDEEFSAKLGGGRHSSGEGGKAGRCYEINITLDGNNLVVYKEDPHADYHETGIRNKLNLGARQGHYTGLMFMKSNIWWIGDPCVRLKAWVDIGAMNDFGTFTPTRQLWVQVLDAIDTGHWYGRPWLTCAIPGNSRAIIRVDQQEESSYDCQFCFCARIIGGPGSFE